MQQQHRISSSEVEKQINKNYAQIYNAYYIKTESERQTKWRSECIYSSVQTVLVLILLLLFMFLALYLNWLHKAPAEHLWSCYVQRRDAHTAPIQQYLQQQNMKQRKANENEKNAKILCKNC